MIRPVSSTRVSTETYAARSTSTKERKLTSPPSRRSFAKRSPSTVLASRNLRRKRSPEGVGIRVNCVSPGSINTARPAHRSARVDPKGKIPLGRSGEPEEIAAVVRFLCGPGGGFITGQTIHVNGGDLVFA